MVAIATTVQFSWTTTYCCIQQQKLPDLKSYRYTLIETVLHSF